MKRILKEQIAVRGPFYVYGAGIVATGIYTAMKEIYHVLPKAFIVSELQGNPDTIDGIPVWELSAVSAEPDAKYVIAAPQVHHKAITESLCDRGMQESQLIYVGNQLENELMEKYYREEPEFKTVAELFEKQGELVEEPRNQWNENLQNGEEKGVDWRHTVLVVQAKCHVDKPLACAMKMPGYIEPLQVGAVFTQEVIATLRDNVGEQISDKNRNYCELTATYSLWKNHQAKYKGLCHYRRIFDISEEQMQQLTSQNESEDIVDVILPYPSIHYPDISSQHSRYVKESDWEAMLQALEEVAPEYYQAYRNDISKQQYFYNYNMLIAKQEVFDDYCNFLFGVLQRTEELSLPKGNERADRYIGYLGENLTTIYFLKNKENLKIAHTGKLMLI